MSTTEPDTGPSRQDDDQDGARASKSAQPEGNSVKRDEARGSTSKDVGKDRLKSEKIGHRRVKEGVITYKKTPTNMLMGAIQLGLEHAVGMITNKPKRDLLMVHFSETTVLDFPSEGSTNTAAHHFGEFRFKAYAQSAFRHFREEFDIKADDFLVSLARDPMRELSNPGASGSVFYLSADDDFIIKTVQHKEAKFLQSLLPGYYMNLVQNKRTLLPKFFGLYCYQNNFGRNIRFVVMNNLLPSTIKYHEKYDLKGSTFKRLASDKELAKKSPTLKDLDFMRLHPDGILLEQDKYNAVMDTLRRDTTVLESFKIMDYSLLLGIHNVDEELRSRQSELATTASSSARRSVTIAAGERARHPSQESTGGLGSSGPVPKQRQSFSIVQEHGYASVVEDTDGGHLPYEIPLGGISARDSKGDRLVLYIGIIDILQSYRLRKKLEHSFKSVVHDGDTVSVHRPSFYADRFRSFFSKQAFKPYKATVRRKGSTMRRQRSQTNPLSMTRAASEDPDTDVSKKHSTASGSDSHGSPGTAQVERPMASSDQAKSAGQPDKMEEEKKEERSEAKETPHNTRAEPEQETLPQTTGPTAVEAEGDSSPAALTDNDAPKASGETSEVIQGGARAAGPSGNSSPAADESAGPADQGMASGKEKKDEEDQEEIGATQEAKEDPVTFC